jgi:hypothetical protein
MANAEGNSWSFFHPLTCTLNFGSVTKQSISLPYNVRGRSPPAPPR